jgi:hypothetical protein
MRCDDAAQRPAEGALAQPSTAGDQGFGPPMLSQIAAPQCGCLLEMLLTFRTSADFKTIRRASGST